MVLKTKSVEDRWGVKMAHQVLYLFHLRVGLEKQLCFAKVLLPTLVTLYVRICTDVPAVRSYRTWGTPCGKSSTCT